MQVGVRTAALLASTALVALPVAVPAPAVADDDRCGDASIDEPTTTDATSVPYEQLNVARAHDFSTGAGVGVAVIDSGVAGEAAVNRAGEIVLDGLNKKELRDVHGTMVAGLISGAERDGKITGIAPDARLLSVRVYDRELEKDEDSDDVDLTAGAIAEGINRAVDEAGKYKIKVINVSLTTDNTRSLKAAVKRAQDKGILVVAAVGNRTAESEGETVEPYEPGKNTNRFPAAYDGVLGVSATVPAGDEETDVSRAVLPSRATDVAAPTVDAVTAFPKSSTCIVGDIATSWSTAMVSGLAALVRERYPDYTPEQTAARIMETANGSTDDRNVFTGFGVIQPVEALTRDLTISRDGEVAGAEPQPQKATAAAAPDPPTDRYADARKSFVWWGLLAGGALVLAALLRPLFVRRR